MDNDERSPYSAPQSQLAKDPIVAKDSIVLEYVGFWPRVGASLIDTVLLLIVIIPVMYWTYGAQYFSNESFLQGPVDFLFNYIFPAIVVCLFWVYRSATPGKIAIDAVIVDARTGQKPTTIQFIGRYMGYFISLLGFCMGYFWVGWDRRKQGWHDKLAGTVVVRDRNPKNVVAIFETDT